MIVSRVSIMNCEGVYLILIVRNSTGKVFRASTLDTDAARDEVDPFRSWHYELAATLIQTLSQIHERSSLLLLPNSYQVMKETPSSTFNPFLTFPNG